LREIFRQAGVGFFLSLHSCCLLLFPLPPGVPSSSPWRCSSGFGLLVGAAVAPTITYYARANPQALWEAGGAIALFVAGFGALGYAVRRDLSAIARALSWGLLALILFGVVSIPVNIPHSSVAFAVAGLVIFAGLTSFDFQRLRRVKDIRTAL
jgi:FtsH-binding integral membrane protein